MTWLETHTRIPAWSLHTPGSFCDKCGVTFTTQHALLRHITSRHEESQSSTAFCNICQRFFKTKWSLATHNRTRKPGQLCNSDSIRTLESHFPEYVPSTPKKMNATRRCKVCASKGMRKESRYYCAYCNVGLCVTPCFKEYHIKSNVE